MHNYIQRQDLIDLLMRGRDFPLTLSIAPAGSGKSVLLEQWRDRIALCEPAVKVIQFEISKRHNEGNILFAQMFEAVQSIAQLWDEQFFSMFKDDRYVESGQFISVFCQALEQITHPVVLIFDDFHNVNAKHIHFTIEKLVRRLPAHVNLVIASRAYPSFSISRMKVDSSVFVIDSNDYKLSEDDIKKLHNTIGVPELNAEQAFNLLQQTEGWFVGTKLAILAYEKRGTGTSEIFSGNHSDLLDYFGHEVIHRLSQNLKEFVLSTAICESFNQELCEHVFGVDYASAKVEEFSMQVFFLRADSKRNGWYCYHPVVRDFLLKILEKERGQAYIQKLHFKAAEFFLCSGEGANAIYHARYSSKREYYYKVLEGICEHWFKEGELELIIEELDKLTDEELCSNSSLLIFRLYALCFNRYFNQAAYYLDMLNRLANDSSDSKLKAYFDFFDRFLTVFKSASESAKLKLRKAPARSVVPAEIKVFNRLIDAYLTMCNGNLNSAFKEANEAQVLLHRMSHKFFDSFATSIIILCDRYLGRGIEAVQHMNKVFNPIRDGKRTPRWVNLATGMMVVDYEQNKLEQSQRLGLQLVPLVNHACATEAVAMVYLYSSRIMYINGETSKAGRLLDQLERILSLGDYQRYNSQLIHEKMRQAYSEARLNDCNLIFERYGLEEFTKIGSRQFSSHYEEWRERLALSAAYWLILKGRFKRAEEILEDIACLLDVHGIKSRALIARCNLIMISYRQGNKDTAVNSLKKMIDRYGLVCFSRSVFDEAPGLALVFQDGIDHGELILPALFTDTFSSLVDTNNLSIYKEQPQHVLTDKELEIFNLLVSGLSNEMISKQSGIALSTTKWHLKNIYSKLGVSNRTAAVHLALKQETAEREV